MDVRSAARHWADVWSRSWPTRDIDAIAALYADGAAYRSHAFRKPYIGPSGAREYVEEAFEGDDELECWFGEPLTTGPRAAVEWWAVFQREGKDHTIAGTTILRFDDAGRVAEHCDYWYQEEGRYRAWPTWGK